MVTRYVYLIAYFYLIQYSSNHFLNPSIMEETIHPFSIPLILHRIAGNLESIPGYTEHKAGVTLDSVATCHSAQSHSHSTDDFRDTIHVFVLGTRKNPPGGLNLTPNPGCARQTCKPLRHHAPLGRGH